MTLLYEIQEDVGIATITFNRPKALNALNKATLCELASLLERIEKDESIRGLVLTGGSGKAFVAGADIAEIQQLSPSQARKFSQMGQMVLNSLEQLAIPVVAAVNGYALGGGCEIALACDFVYAADSAIFGLPEIHLGIIPGFGGTQRLPLLVGLHLAREMIYSGKRLSAAEAKDVGLVNRCLPPEALLPEVNALMKSLAQNSRTAMRAAKEVIRNGSMAQLANGMVLERDAFAYSFTGPDAKEGTSAFLEKRKANFIATLDS